MEKKALQSEYESKLVALKDLAETVKFWIHKEITRKKIKIHSFSYRVKRFDSFIDKIREKKITDPFNEVGDLIGLRVVCLFVRDVKLVGDIVRSSFNILEEDNKIEGDDVDIFGYMSLHFTAKLKQANSDRSFPPIGNIPSDYLNYPFEVQVRTVAQDAWASISHHLDYKQASQIPPELKRDFYALSGLFYVADKHFEMLQDQTIKRAIREAMKK